MVVMTVFTIISFYSVAFLYFNISYTKYDICLVYFAVIQQPVQIDAIMVAVKEDASVTQRVLILVTAVQISTHFALVQAKTTWKGMVSRYSI